MARDTLVNIEDSVTGTLAVVKAASTAPVAADAALVVTVSPNGSVFLGNDTYSAKAVSGAASGNNTIHTPAADKAIRLYYVCLSADGANTADTTSIVKFAAGGATLYKHSLKAGSMWARNIGAGRHYIQGAADAALIVNLSAAQTVNVSIEFDEV